MQTKSLLALVIACAFSQTAAQSGASASSSSSASASASSSASSSGGNATSSSSASASANATASASTNATGGGSASALGASGAGASAGSTSTGGITGQSGTAGGTGTIAGGTPASPAAQTAAAGTPRTGAVTQTWAFQSGSAQYDNVLGVSVDTARSTVYLAGQTWGKPFGTPSYARNDIMDYYSDFWAAKLDLAAGTQVWSYQAQSSKQDYFASASVDPASGDLIVSGTTQGTYSCANSCQWQAGSVVILPDIVAARLDKTSGKATWTFQDGTLGSEIGSAASVSPVTGETVIAGSASSDYASTRADQPPLGDTRAYPYDSDFAVVRLDAKGAKVYAFQEGTLRADALSAVAHDAAGAAFVAGTTYGDYAIKNQGGADIVVIKLDPAGKSIFRYQFGTAADDTVSGIAVDAAGDAIITGSVQDNFFVQKISGTTGTAVWTWTDGSTGSDVAEAITVGTDGTIVIVGKTSGSYAAPNKGLYDFVAVGLSSDGKKIWGWQAGTGSTDRLSSVAPAGVGSYVLGGDTYGSYSATNAGGWDVIAIRLNVAAA